MNTHDSVLASPAPGRPRAGEPSRPNISAQASSAFTPMASPATSMAQRCRPIAASSERSTR